MGVISMKERIERRFIKFINVICITAIYALCWFEAYGLEISDPFFYWGNWVLVGLFGFIYFNIARLYHGFDIHLRRISETVYSQILAVIFSNILLYMITVLINRHLMHLAPLVVTLVVQGFLIAAWGVLSHRWYFHAFPPKKTILVDGGHRNMAHLIQRYGVNRHFQVIGSLAAHDCVRDMDTALHNAEVVILGSVHSHERNQILKYCIMTGKLAYFLPRIGDTIVSGATPSNLFHLPLQLVYRYSPKPEYLIIKRMYDIILSLIALICFSPVMLCVAIAIKRTDGGAIFYRQARLTKDGKVFDVLKFRSMRMDAEKDGVARLSAGEADPRITKVGRIIRACRIDELPQLLNILRGDMAIVGPRPERPEIAAQYEKELPEWNLRLQCKCGLTGYAQVYGQYNTTPYDKLLMDLLYIANPSLTEDFKIIFGTVKILFMKESTEGVAVNQSHAKDNLQKDN
jgi:exopolysaccharide biosynthesis polyprenyl glycosylphosphotransferase